MSRIVLVAFGHKRRLNVMLYGCARNLMHKNRAVLESEAIWVSLACDVWFFACQPVLSG
jgi:hypothetical protein